MLRDLAQDESLREIVARIVESGKDYARAEVRVVKETATARVNVIRPAMILFVCALLLVQAALTVLAAALGMGLAHWLGAAGGLAVGAIIVLGLAGGLAALGVSKLKQAFQ